MGVMMLWVQPVHANKSVLVVVIGCRDLQRAGRSELQLASSLALLAYSEDPVVQGACRVLSDRVLKSDVNIFGALRIKKEKK